MKILIIERIREFTRREDSGADMISFAVFVGTVTTIVSTLISKLP